MWEHPKGRGMPRCQAHASHSWRGGPAGRGLGALAQRGLARRCSAQSPRCRTGTEAQAGTCLLTPTLLLLDTEFPRAPDGRTPWSSNSKTQACLLLLPGSKSPRAPVLL